jgi:hypothetical protein
LTNSYQKSQFLAGYCLYHQGIQGYPDHDDQGILGFPILDTFITHATFVQLYHTSREIARNLHQVDFVFSADRSRQYLAGAWDGGQTR